MSTYKNTNRVKFIDEHMENFEHEVAQCIIDQINVKFNSFSISRVQLYTGSCKAKTKP